MNEEQEGDRGGGIGRGEGHLRGAGRRWRVGDRGGGVWKGEGHLRGAWRRWWGGDRGGKGEVEFQVYWMHVYSHQIMIHGFWYIL